MKNFETALVPETVSIRDVIETINRSPVHAAFVVKDTNLLVGAVTDGDVRRGLLRGLSLDAAVTEVMNKTPLSVKEGVSHQDILAFMRDHTIYHVPVVDEENHIVSVKWFEQLRRQKQDQKNWVVIMAGGLGTRLHPLTLDTPKPMLSVGDKPLLEKTILHLASQGFTRFYFSVNYKSEVIEDHFGDGEKWGVEIRYLREDKRLGTAGALSLLPEKPDDLLIVMNGDVMSNVDLRSLIRYHEDHECVATICAREYRISVPYGVLDTDGVYLNAVREKPNYQYMVNSGIYALSPDCLSKIPADEYFDMPTLFNVLMADEQKISVFPLHEYWIDVGKIDDLEKARDDIDSVYD